jgi:2-aminoadipate transaminase
MAERLVTAKQAADLHTSSFTQRLVWEHVRRPGLLEEHIRGLCSVYGWRRDAMLFALERHFPAEARWTRPEGGLFLWVELPTAIDTTALLTAALHERVAFVPGEPFWIGTPRRHTLRLNFSNASDERIEEGVRRLGAVIRSALA